MAHFAEIDENSIVVRVLVTDNDAPNEGYDWLIQNLGGTWVKTSYNGNIRKNFAASGYTYNSSIDAFIGPKPEGTWILNEETCKWERPIQYPNDGLTYFWNESELNWELQDFSEPEA